MGYKHEILCRSGQYVHDRGHIRCSECEPGFWCTNAKKHICPSGKYQDAHRATFCQDCAHSRRMGATTCVKLTVKPTAQPEKIAAMTPKPVNNTDTPVAPKLHTTLPPEKRVVAHSFTKAPQLGFLPRDPLVQGSIAAIIACVVLLLPRMKRCYRRRGRQRRRGRARRA